MNTFDGKTISKKSIQTILRSENRTEIFRLVHHIYGGKVDRHAVCLFIKEFASSQRTRRKAYSLAYEKDERVVTARELQYSFDFRRQNKRHEIIAFLRNEIKRGLDGYTKVPIYGHTHLYFASPVYGHRDYNKWAACEIKGNERFCELLVAVAKKHFNM